MKFLRGAAPGFGIRLWIVDGSLHFQMPKIRASKALCDVEGVACRMSLLRVEPGLVVKTRRLYDQSIAIPPRRRVAQPGRRCVISQFPAVHKNLPKEIQLLIEDHDEARRLNDFERKKAVGVDSGNAVREAARQRIIDVIASYP